MSVILFDAALERGGPTQFKDLPEAILWAQHQDQAWAKKFRLTLAANRDSNLYSVRNFWSNIIADLQSHRARGGPVGVTIADDVRMVVENSPTFKAMSWAYDNLTKEGLEAAAAAAGLDGRVDWSIPEQVNAVFSYERVLNKILSSMESEKLERGRIFHNELNDFLNFTKREMDNLSDRFSSLRDEGDKLKVLYDNQESRYKGLFDSSEKVFFDRLSETSDKIEREEQQILEKINSISDSAKEFIDNWVNSFQEQRRLEAPVALWRNRAELHQNVLEERRWWLISVGVIGLILAFIIAISSFKLAEVIFSGVVVPGGEKVVKNLGTLRPSFQFEIITASAATLIYLTMYLWVMRLLMRLYTAEHHLAIDAYGRSALTETYLSLTQEGAATDADRAIMLSVIFRPVSDGMVKEDGPPAISPAALIAGLASGPTKAS